MGEKQGRKMDRRTRYTRNAVKDSLLELLRHGPFEKVTVAALCRQAEITRATFYLHYDDLTAVVEELVEDALQISEANSSGADLMENLYQLARAETLEELRQCNDLFPACQRVADEAKYLPLLEDDTLAPFIIRKIYLTEREKASTLYTEHTNLTPQEAELIFLHDIYGAFFLNRAMKWKKDDQWYRVHGLLSRFRLGGLEALRDKPLK